MPKNVKLAQEEQKFMAIQGTCWPDYHGHSSLSRHHHQSYGLKNNIIKLDFSKISNSFAILCWYSINNKQ